MFWPVGKNLSINHSTFENIFCLLSIIYDWKIEKYSCSSLILFTEKKWQNTEWSTLSYLVHYCTRGSKVDFTHFEVTGSIPTFCYSVDYLNIVASEIGALISCECYTTKFAHWIRLPSNWCLANRGF